MIENMISRGWSRVALGLLIMIGVLVHADTTATTAEELVGKVLDQTRGLTSYSELTMTVKRPEWNRKSSFSVWTRGREDALIRFTAPPRDVGNATLKKGDQMWTFSPKIKRTVRLPRSMMSQGWAGSDFSYNDLARSDSLLQHYELAIVQDQTEGDHTI
ncbi:MAG: outer membrane lipoprotein-sorting protein, partial [Gammaproteobacteria bacterium]|nr:outer membrane lipoprotein-sorting protein [Gammaproteobacteria bacterium]